MANFSISYIYQIKDQMGPTLKRITRNIKSQNDALTLQQRIWTRLVTMQGKFHRAVKKSRQEVGKLKDELKNSVGALVGIGATFATIAFPVKQAMEFENSMAGVAKAANLDKGTQQFNAMSDTIRQMSKEIPKTATELATMFESGARLGIDAKDLPDFARLTAKTAVAFDMMAETAGDSLASIGAKMGVPISGMESMMDAVNTLENNTASKGNQMIDIIGRIAGTAKSIDLSPEQTAGLASFANQITVSPELAASGLNMMFNRMQKIPALQKQLLESPEKAVHNMLKSLAKVDKGSRAGMISKIFGDEAGRFVTQAVGSLELYEKTLGFVADKTKFAGSMTREFETQIQTTSAQVTIAQNGLNDVAISLGNQLLPAVKMGAILLQGFTFGLSAIIENTGPLLPMLAAFAGTLATLLLTTKLWTIAQLALNVALAANPIGLVIGAIAALAAGVVYCYDQFAAFKTLVDSVWETVSDFLGIGGNDLTVNVNKNGEMAQGDARGSAGANGQVAVDVTAKNAEVNDVQVQGAGLRANAIGYSTYMAGVS